MSVANHPKDCAVYQTSIRVFIANADQQFRCHLRSKLEQEKDMVLVGECSQGIDVTKLCRKLYPDVVVLDLGLPQMDGAQITDQLCQISPQIKVLIIADQHHPKILESIRYGASGSLPRGMKMEQIVIALRLIAYGEVYIHPIMLKQLIVDWRRLSQQEEFLRQSHHSSFNRREFLTDREIEVLQLMAQGKKNRLISKHLSISEKTVKNHVSNILHKLNVQDRTQAVLLAIKYGWVTLI